MLQAHRQAKVLIVDDESAIRRALRNTLHGMGFDVEDASSGEAALDLVREAEYDVVLMDINMPGIGGIRACREIRRSLPRLGILMLTVRDREEDKITALDAGADDYITKPFNIRELAARITRVKAIPVADGRQRDPHLDCGAAPQHISYGHLRALIFANNGPSRNKEKERGRKNSSDRKQGYI